MGCGSLQAESKAIKDGGAHMVLYHEIDYEFRFHWTEAFVQSMSTLLLIFLLCNVVRAHCGCTLHSHLSIELDTSQGDVM